MTNRLSRAEAIGNLRRVQEEDDRKKDCRSSPFSVIAGVAENYASVTSITEPLKISAEARVESEGIVTYGELFAWRKKP